MTKQNSDSAPEAQTFHDLGIEPRLLDLLDRLNFTIPTPIQQQAIPVGIAGSDIIGIAQTGTGKTLAFGIPILQRLVKSGGKGCGRSLIILPTRELALQVEQAISAIGKTIGLRTAVLIGGAPMRPQQSELRANPDIIIATPGRLIDHMQQRIVDLRTVDTLVLDEADRMLDMGFAPQIKQILNDVPRERQTMLFSATMPDQIVKIADQYMNAPVRIEVERAGTLADNLTQELFVVPQEEKNDLLANLLDEYRGTVLVFARTRSRAHRICRVVRNLDHSAAEIHADRTLTQRRAALDGFKSGTYRVLVATDIAARGIDVTGIEVVVNYDLPDCAEDYVHRIGRTGRAGQTGHAVSFAAPDQQNDVRDIEKLIRVDLAISEFSQYAFEPSANRNSGGRRSQQRGASQRQSPRRTEAVVQRSVERSHGPSAGTGAPQPGHRPSGPPAARPLRRGRATFSGRPGQPRR